MGTTNQPSRLRKGFRMMRNRNVAFMQHKRVSAATIRHKFAFSGKLRAFRSVRLIFWQYGTGLSSGTNGTESTDDAIRQRPGVSLSSPDDTTQNKIFWNEHMKPRQKAGKQPPSWVRWLSNDAAEASWPTSTTPRSDVTTIRIRRILSGKCPSSFPRQRSLEARWTASVSLFRFSWTSDT